MDKEVYIFLDESGNFDFSRNGTRYIVFTALTTTNPILFSAKMNVLKNKLLANGIDKEYFHASEDKQFIRDKVFDILQEISGYEIDSVIVEKAKTNPSLREPKIFYLRICEYLLKYVFRRYKTEKIIILTDRIPVAKKRGAVEKGLKSTIRHYFGKGREFHIYHHHSKSHCSLQAADYCGWAIYKKWTDEELRPYNKIHNKIESEFDIFEKGTTFYY